MNQDKCQSTVMMWDDRWGGFVNQCEGEPGHIGRHFHAMGACSPLAEITWEGNYEELRTFL